MPYNTRRISLSLPSLGVHLPSGSRAHARSASTTDSAPPPKRIKRSHTISSVSSSTSTARTSPPRPQPRTHSVSFARPVVPAASENTPPPSPPCSHQFSKLETEGVNDDIVVGVLKQLEKTGNRPHLIKELVAILINSLAAVESSANPAAIISSRLSNYLKRPWTALAPCPLAKEQTKTHPRAVYYFLTTCPRQDIPEFTTAPIITKRVMSPSISSDPGEEENAESRKRKRDSMSPEVDLMLSELDMPSTHPSANVTFLDSDLDLDEKPTAEEQVNVSHNRRAVSPPLENDEREFTQTASDMQQRKQTEQAGKDQQQQLPIPSPSESMPGFEIMIDQAEHHEDESEEAAALRNRKAANALFGQNNHLLHVGDDGFHLGSSPMLRPLVHHDLHIVTTPKKELGTMDLEIEKGLYDDGGWGELKSAEAVALSELDDLLGGY